MSKPVDNILVSLQSLSWTQLGLATGGLCSAYALVRLVSQYWQNSRSPLRNLPSPKDPANLFWGHLKVLFASESNGTVERWRADLGEVFAQCCTESP